MSGYYCVADVGNSTIDFAEFATSSDPVSPIPSPLRTQKVNVADLNEELLQDWNRTDERCDWLIGSVNKPVSAELEALLLRDVASRVRSIQHHDFELQLAIRNPQSVGIDRLAAAIAANRIRRNEQPAIIVDAGSATTIDVVSKDGVFLGGMIAPGIRLSVDALAKGTDGLPHVKTDFRNSVPSMIGNDTMTAIQAGVFWSAIAAIDGIINRLGSELAGPSELFATGGAITSLLPHLSHKVQHEPHLVLSGLAMAKPW